ncbi:peptidoglycan-binding protein [Maribacter sp.]|uniref:glycoside hydrolase family 19 protein n=1 Tax=Maribacter sp. TaxID=1897614 RepID=UPI0025C25589|nr:peptidoglycan-binding protein [Maribacter sp.]
MRKIVEFQKENGLVPDGIIGKNTLKAFQAQFGVSKIQLAHFLGQLHHETNGFKYDTENLNYSAIGLIKTFSYYRKNKVQAYQDGRTWGHKANQEKIANKVYWDKNRNPSHQLGNTNYGDGWKYRGRGAIQLTGLFNYKKFAKWIKDVTILENPEKVAYSFYFTSAKYFFEENKLWNLANNINRDSIVKITKAINGGLNGIEERIRMTRYYYNKMR